MLKIFSFENERYTPAFIEKCEFVNKILTKANQKFTKLLLVKDLQQFDKKVL